MSAFFLAIIGHNRDNSNKDSAMNHTIRTENGDCLCYDVMEMKQSEANPCKVGVQGSQG